jgi:hypothetical protein
MATPSRAAVCAPRMTGTNAMQRRALGSGGVRPTVARRAVSVTASTGPSFGKVKKVVLAYSGACHAPSRDRTSGSLGRCRGERCGVRVAAVRHRRAAGNSLSNMDTCMLDLFGCGRAPCIRCLG